MLALQYSGNQRVALDEIAEPVPQAGEVLIEVAYTGICGTDLHEYLHGPTWAQPPVIMGHETSGVIVATGGGVPSERKGERVTVIPMDFCGKCFYCHRAEYHLCERPSWVGFTRQGAFARHMAVPARLAIPIPDSVPLDMAALTEHYTVTFHAVRQSRLKLGETVLILGAGPVGLAALQCVVAAGAGRIIVVEPEPLRQASARDAGASKVISPDASGGVADQVRSFTGGGVGVDVVFDAAGRQSALAEGMASLRKGGRYVSLSSWAGAASLDMNDALLKEIQIIFVFGYDMFADFPAVLDLMARGALDAGKQISERISLQDIVERGFKRLAADRGDVIKVLVSLEKEL